jgi:protein TonB
MATSSFGSCAAARAARRRVSAALAVSLSIHLVFAGLIRGGPATVSPRVPVQNFIHARISEPAPQTLPDAPPAALELDRTRSSARREHTNDSPLPVAKSTATRRESNAVTAADTPDAKYYSARELDVYPAPLAPLTVNYTGEATASRSHGYARLAITLDAMGTVTEVQLLEAEPTGSFEGDAVKAIASTRFTPALRHGRPVKTRLVVQVDFGAQPDR